MNEVIHAFMGLPEERGYYYHLNWNKLMKVCVKCSNTEPNEQVARGFMEEIRKKVAVFDIRATHLAVYNFITWYNINK